MQILDEAGADNLTSKIFEPIITKKNSELEKLVVNVNAASSIFNRAKAEHDAVKACLDHILNLERRHNKTTEIGDYLCEMLYSDTQV